LGLSDKFARTDAAVTFGNVIIGTARWAVLYFGAVRASRALYKSLLHAVLRAKLRWFDSMSLGRLLNRFGKDFEG